MSLYLQEDFVIRKFLEKKLKEAFVASIEIERSVNTINIIISTARPGLIIGRGGGGVEKLKTGIEKELEEYRKENKVTENEKKEIKIEIREIKNPWTSAVLVAQMAAQQIEKRVPYRQVMKRCIERVMMNKDVKGVRIEMSGRLNGIEIARSEWLSEGKIPRNTLRADLDYGFWEAHCTYGKIGIKVWIYKGEKFD